MSITAREMRYRLRRKFEANTRDAPMPQHLVMFEVPIAGWMTLAAGVEYPVERRIDAIAVGLWKKRTGNLVHGFEIKVSRSDLLAELNNLEKSAPAVRAVDRWWLALGDPALLRDNDPLPEGWGVLAAVGRGLTAVREAAPQAGELSREFMAAMFQASLRSHGVCRGLGYQKGFAEGFTQGRQRAAHEWRGKLALAEAAFNGLQREQSA